MACGNQTQDICGRTSTTDLETSILRYILSWSASSRDHALGSLDITAASLNAELPAGRVVILRPPTVLYKLGLLRQGFCWKINRAIYGLREAPNLWSEERTSVMSSLRFRAQGDSFYPLVVLTVGLVRRFWRVFLEVLSLGSGPSRSSGDRTLMLFEQQLSVGVLVKKDAMRKFLNGHP